MAVDTLELTLNEIFAQTERLRTAFQDPLDQLIVMADLFRAHPDSNSTPPWYVDANFNTASNQTRAVIRRSALAGIARAVVLYQPSTSNEALGLLQAILELIQQEMELATTNGADNVYSNLKLMRSLIQRHLTSVALNLPELREVDLNGSLPSLAAAYRLYGDANRADELVDSTRVEHSLWLPTKFEARSK